MLLKYQRSLQDYPEGAECFHIEILQIVKKLQNEIHVEKHTVVKNEMCLPETNRIIKHLHPPTSF